MYMPMTQTNSSSVPLRTTGAEALLLSLEALGVDTIFGYPGGAILPVYDALYFHADRLRHILVRHEQGAMHAAQGYARVTGRTGVVIVTSGPGAANCVTGLSDAMMDSTPLVVITGQVGARYLGSDAFQETDVVAVTQPITKWAYQVRDSAEVPEAVARAFYIASTGRPGPVVLDISKDAQVGLLDFEFKPVSFIRSYNPDPVMSPEAVRQAAELINAAERPLLLAGQGVALSGAEARLRALAEKAQIPVAETLLGRSILPTGHPLLLGMAGMHGAVAANWATNRADLIVAVGMRFDDRVTGNVDLYAPEARVVHIDIDASEFNKTVACDVAVHADAGRALEALLPLVREATHEAWLADMEPCRRAESETVESAELHRTGEQPMTMGEVAAAVSAAAPDGTVAVTDVGQNQMMTARYFRYSAPRSLITSGGLGTMGFGLPAAIGAAIGAPGRTVCYFGGDGGFQMTVQELGTIMQYAVPVKMILLDNNFLGNVRQWQTLFFGGRYSQTPLLNPDFKTLCAAYGIPAEDVATRAELPAAVRRMLDHDGPYLLNVAIDPEDMVFPMTPVGKAVDYIMLDSSKLFEHDR